MRSGRTETVLRRVNLMAGKKKKRKKEPEKKKERDQEQGFLERDGWPSMATAHRLSMSVTRLSTALGRPSLLRFRPEASLAAAAALTFLVGAAVRTEEPVSGEKRKRKREREKRRRLRWRSSPEVMAVGEVTRRISTSCRTTWAPPPTVVRTSPL